MDADELTLASRFELTRVDRDIFTGYCHAGAPLRAFGGQVAAQALVAAGTTVDIDERPVHSLHGYFLRPGRTTDPIAYLVERPRDGGSFSTRLVRAVQFGETIFTMSASFARPEEGAQRGQPMPEAPDPETLTEARLPVAAMDPKLRDMGYPDERLIDVRLVHADYAATGPGGPKRMAWFKSCRPLGDRLLDHVCSLTYFSDVTLAGTTVADLDTAEREKLNMASLDHAMWFHDRFRTDEWVLFVQDSHIAAHGRSLARGEFFQSGRLVATAVQEVLQRRARSKD